MMSTMKIKHCLTERCCFSDLVEGLSSPCPCGLTVKPWTIESVVQVSIAFIIASTLASYL